MSMSQPNLFTRDDTFFGVCAGLGEDFGFNPLYLRVALGVSLLWSPVAVLAAYAAGAVLVVISRLIVPNPRMAATAQAGDAGIEAAAASGQVPAAERTGDSEEEFAIAA
ncbi:MAG TPA: PspC domain-containing protein [Allosphingosinicella sp.]|nr:PspC domain-containing protein [Allosphingosinicella sp.]